MNSHRVDRVDRESGRERDRATLLRAVSSVAVGLFSSLFLPLFLSLPRGTGTLPRTLTSIVRLFARPEERYSS